MFALYDNMKEHKGHVETRLRTETLNKTENISLSILLWVIKTHLKTCYNQGVVEISRFFLEPMDETSQHF